MIDFFLKRSFVVNTIMVFVLLLGVWGFVNIPRTVIPSVSFNRIEIALSLSGATSSEVEKHVVFPIENALRGLGLPTTYMTSDSKTNGGIIVLGFKPDFKDYDQTINQIKTAIDGLKNTLPKDLEVTSVMRPSFDVTLAADVYLQGVRQDNLQDRAWIKMIQDELRNTAGILDVKSDCKPLDIYIEFSPSLMAAAELSVEEVRTQIGKFVDFSQVGELDGKNKIAITLKSGMQDLEEIKHLPVVANRSGDIIYLQDLAKVEYRFPRSVTRLISKNHADVSFQAMISITTDILKAKRAVSKKVEQLQASLPSTLNLWVREDGQAFSMQQQFGVLRGCGLQGLIIIALLLTFFFGHRFAGVMLLGLPVAYGAVLAMMHLLDISLTLTSLLGALLVVGILTDDTVIITEQYLLYLRKDFAPLDAIKQAVRTTIIPITGTVLTTFAVFLPMILVKSDNQLADFYKAVPIIIIVALSFSFFETFFLLPNHLKHLNKNDQAHWSTALIQKAIMLYRKILKHLFKWRYLALLLAVALVGSAKMTFKQLDIFFDDVPVGSNSFYIDIELKQSTSLDDSEQKLASLVRLLDGLVGPDQINNYFIELGRHNYQDDRNFNFTYGEIYIRTKIKDRPFMEIKRDLQQQIRQWLQEHQDLFDLFRFSDRPQFARSIYEESMQLYVSGGDQLDFDKIHQEVAHVLKDVAGLEQLRLDQANNQDQWQFVPDRIKMLRYKMDNATLASQLRGYFTPQELRHLRMRGESLTIYTLLRGKHDFTFEDLAKVRVLTPAGVSVKTTELGTWQKQKTLGTIHHSDLFRRFTLSVDYQKDKYSREDISKNIQQALKPLQIKYPAYKFTIDTYSAKEKENISWMQKVGMVALGTMVVVLMLCLQSLFKPFYVLAVVPLAVAGTLWMMVFSKIQLNVNSVIGLIGMAGVAINDAILMAATLKEGIGHQALARKKLIDSAAERLRPVMITTITTLAGIFPLIYFGDINVTFYTRPMFFTFAWGIFIATLATLFLLPTFNLILDDVKSLLTKAWVMVKSHFKDLGRTTGMILGGVIGALALGHSPEALAKTAANSLSLPAYIKIAFTKEENHQIAQEEAQKEQIAAQAAQSFLNLHGGINPRYKKYQDPHGPRTKALEANVTSNLLATGTKLQGAYTKSKISEVAGKRDYDVHELSLTVTQSLGKNALGRATVAAGKAQASFARQKAVNAQQSRVQTCVEAIKDYYVAFSGHAKVVIYQEAYQLIQKRQKQLKINYKQHLIPSLTYLQGSADSLKIKGDLDNYLKLAKAAETKIGRFVEQSDYELSDPRPLLEALAMPANLNFAKSPDGQKLALNLDQAKFKQEQAAFDTYPQLDLALEFKKIDPQENERNVVREKVITLKLDTDFTIFDRAVRQEKQLAAIDAQLAQRKLRKGEQDYKKQLADAYQELQTKQEALVLERQKTDLYRKVLHEQQRRLRNAKIEFADYLQDRDKYIQSRLAQLDIFADVLAAKLALWLASDQVPPLCLEPNA